MVHRDVTEKHQTATEVRKGAPDRRTDLFGGRGTVSVWNLLDAAAPPFTAVLSCELAPEGSVGPHRQQEYPEILIGLAGDGEVTVDGKPVPLVAGETVYLPLGSILTVSNRSTQTVLRYLIVKARSVSP